MGQCSGVVNHFIGEISTENRDLLLASGLQSKYKRGEVIFREGENAKSIFLIVKGKVSLTKTTLEQQSILLQVKEKYELIGALHLFSRNKYSFTAEVIEDATIIEFDLPLIEELVINKNDLAIILIKWLTNSFQESLTNYFDAVSCQKSESLSSFLLRLCKNYGINQDNKIFIKKRITIDYLAAESGLSMEEAKLSMEKLISQKVISNKNRFITVHDIKYLQSELNCKHCSFAYCYN